MLPNQFKVGIAIASLSALCARCSAAVVEFNDTYVGVGVMVADQMTFRINGYEDPTSTTTKPLHLHFVGHMDRYWMPLRKKYAKFMSDQEYVSANIEFENTVMCMTMCDTSDYCTLAPQPGYSSMLKRAKDVFKAVTKLCNRATVDCAKGIALSGFSYGGWLSLLMAQVDFDYPITALWTFSVAKYSSAFLTGRGLPPAYHSLIDYSCFADTYISQFVPQSKRLMVNGGKDHMFSGGAPNMGLDYFTGIDDCDSYDCIQADGSGYYIIPEADFTQEDRDEYSNPNGHVPFGGHYFHLAQAPVVKNFTTMLPTFENGTEKWSMPNIFTWLADAGRVGMLAQWRAGWHAQERAHKRAGEELVLP